METKMTVFLVFLLALVSGSVHHSHGRTYESESITINGSTDALAVKSPSNIRPECDLCCTIDGNTDTLPSDGLLDYDYLKLVLQWPQSFCNSRPIGKECTGEIPKHFTVHGLWPQRIGKFSCCNSANTFVDYSQLEPRVLQYMKKYWPNLTSRDDNFRFWNHEYGRHGSCFSQFHSPHLSYFEETVAWARVIDIMFLSRVLGEIRPHDNRGNYRLGEIEYAIWNHFGVIPRLRCNHAQRDAQRDIQLYEIEFCFEKWARTDCNNNFGDFSGCGDSQEVKFHRYL